MVVFVRLLLVALLGLPFGGWAQVPTVQIDVREQAMMLPNSPPFRVVQILDLRANPFAVGTTLRGSGNLPIPVNLRGGAEVNLLEWIHHRLPARETARPVLMRIHELVVEETPKPAASATAAVDVDFVVVEADSSYRVVQRFAETVTRIDAKPAALHAENLAACFRRIFSALNAANWAQRLAQAPVVPARQFYHRNGMAPTPEKADAYPILLNAPTRGVYPDFVAFRRNQPRTDVAFDVVTRGPDEVKLYEGTGANRHVTHAYWGFFDGKQLYLRANDRYWPLRRHGRHLAFRADFGPDDATVETAAALGGVVPGAVAAVVTDKGLQEYTLDLTTGRVADYAYLAQLAERDTAVVYVYRRLSADRQAAAAPVPLRVDGTDIGPLTVGGVVRLPWTDKRREISLTVPGAGPETIAFIPDFTQPTYVEVRPVENSAQLLLNLATSKEGEFYVKKLQRR